jgi:formate hydrogenlyase subunit 3/multisubunit Na+/H+ antiporter MnhD subunit
MLVISGIINAICFFPVIINAFRGENTKTSIEKGSRISLMLAPTLILVIIALFTGLIPGIVWPGVEAVVNWFY